MVPGSGDGLIRVRRKNVRVIEESLRNRGYLLSLGQIGDVVGLAGTSSVSDQLSALPSLPDSCETG